MATRAPLETRFWSKVDKRGPDECWEWRAYRDKCGYGRIAANGKPSASASRIAWEIAHGPIPSGLYVCHHCDNPPCVNPAHLWLGTNADNIRDMLAKGRWTRSVRDCGHERTPENNYNDPRGWRSCRQCRSLATHRYRARKRALKQEQSA